MLHLHFSNRYEALMQQLLGRLAAGRRGPLVADQIIVPSAAVRRSLTLAIADHEGICANVQFGFLARWLWQQIGRLVPSVAAESPFTPAVLGWRIFTAFGDEAFVAAHPRLQAYLRNADAVMRYELARRVAGLLEQYVTYRPDWLAAWQAGQPAGLAADAEAALADERWQAALWQRITEELALGALDPVQGFVAVLQRGGAAAALQAGLPHGAHVFALPTMAPLHVRLLQQIGQAIELHVYVLNPCREYWFELIEPRRLGHLASRGRAEGHEVANRLLATWGRQTQAHVDVLVDSAGDAADDDSHFETHPGGSLLARLHNAILDMNELEPGTVTLADDDRSIELHVCHSLTRELEVLHDHLLGLFAAAAEGAGPALRPGDILVVTPDLDAAAPLIEAVFGTAPAERNIPYTVTGRSRSRINTLARVLLALLSLAGSRIAASAVFGLLQQPIVARRFRLDDEALQQVHGWMHASGMRWALDAEHRATFDLPAEPRHTLADGLDRLFLGYALPASVAEPFAGLLPQGDAEGLEALALGGFWHCVDALQQLQALVATPQTPAAWVGLLQDAIDTFMQAGGDELDDLRELNEALNELADTMQRGGVTQPVPLAVVRAALVELLDDPARGGVPTGNVTFSSMSSLRSLPYAVVCAIGLNDGTFPSVKRPPEFDLMALAPRRGDRQRRDDERNVFLDLLLAARRGLYLSHTGRSVRDNSALPPSVLVSDLLDVLVPAITGDPADPTAGARARRRLVVEHPLQPFSIEAFSGTGDERLRSFNRELSMALQRSLATAPTLAAPEAAMAAGAGAPADGAGDRGDMGDDEALDGDDAEAAAPALPFFGAPLAPPGAEWRQVSVAQLAEFFRNPCRYLLRRRLGIELQRDADELLDEEPFLPDWPGRMALARRLLPQLLQGTDADAVRGLALAGTEMPSGSLGRRELDDELASLARFAARVREATATPCLPPHQGSIDLDIDGEAWRLQASFADLRPTGLLRWHHDQRRAGDALEAWLQHLALCADPPPQVRPRTQWLTTDGTLTWRKPEHPVDLLRPLLQIYRRGLREPVHFFPKSAWAYVNEGQKLSAAQKTWRVSEETPHAEGADAAYRLALRGTIDPLDDAFETLALAVFGPLMEHVDDGA